MGWRVQAGTEGAQETYGVAWDCENTPNHDRDWGASHRAYHGKFRWSDRCDLEEAQRRLALYTSASGGHAHALFTRTVVVPAWSRPGLPKFQLKQDPVEEPL